MKNTRSSERDARPTLPTHRSTARLDERVLARARANAPRKRPAHFARWSGGLATAALLVVAVLVTVPGQEPSPVLDEKQQPPGSPPATPTAVAADAMMKMSTDERSSRESPRRIASPQQYSEAGADAEADADADADAGNRSKQADFVQFNRIVPADSPTPQASELLTPEALSLELQRYREMLHAGSEKRARAEYRKLQLDCPDCALPETLEEAITRYLGN